MNLENIILSNIWPKKGTVFYDFTYVTIWSKQFINRKENYGSPALWGEQNGELVFNGHTVSAGDDGRFWKCIVVTVVQ
jgi:hypothetical protein